ncbi:hypothetical protein AOL_s00097g320 [Orbilia oligospora ATCC 24927]|uniref:Radical SAM core domain-containing protein n=1 Tax=Arthrobotrys oligospora (strain ATCC 24927 / CBS 115.81 / DSM 1491) TaxID=756982 RepID=G1XIZ3_ARTOA|nr:hypothetical protein AOL_s00097g320 [Orbilia oligospora ATCC 24927]EGX46894.1 hypothetical protein AOL_s00097g320 [Orbilia oligospora ATCC 24927]
MFLNHSFKTLVRNRHPFLLRCYSNISPAFNPPSSAPAPIIPVPAYQNLEREPYWQKIPQWKSIKEEEFLKYSWQIANTVQSTPKLFNFLESVLPSKIPHNDISQSNTQISSQEEFILDVMEGINLAPMSTRLTPHTLSRIDWINNPLGDPLRKQFIPMKSSVLPDHPKLTLDSLGETNDSPVQGLVHRYPDKALFLAISVCPVYCRFCTRSYSIGGETPSTKKSRFLPTRKRWSKVFDYIASTPSLHDIVISGGDAYYLDPQQILEIGQHLLSIPHIRRIRYASKGLAVCPSRILDGEDSWAETLVQVSAAARMMGKSVALHTHFNHPNEITWVTKLAAQRLYESGVTVRNQTVLLRGVNDDCETMKGLIHGLAEMNIQPYYVYQGDMVRGVEDLRTPLHKSLELERNIRGTIAGFMMPQFVVDLPAGGGKRLVSSYDSYDRKTGVSRFTAPGVKGTNTFEYHDPVWSVAA